FKDLLGLDDFMKLCLRRVRLRIHDIDTGGTDARDDEIAAFEESVAGQRRKGGGAGIPAEMMELVPLIRHGNRVNHLAKCWGAGLYVDHCKRVRFREIRAQQQGVSEILRRGLHCKLRRSMESRIGPHCHSAFSSLFSRGSLLSAGSARVRTL